MIYTNSHLQALYSGFYQTELLWKNNQVRNLEQLDIENYDARFDLDLERRLRLGQLAERFVFNQLKSATDYEIIAESLQIQNDKLTVGELDALIRYKSQPIHLEIVYKLYLHDDTLGNTEIEKWIGPNRRDSLIEKLDKLSEKQLPLIYSPHCEDILKAYQLEIKHIKQNVLFKAQLFTPYQTEVPFEQLNPECIKGFYINQNQLHLFTDCKFYIPPKIDWFLNVHTQVDWQTFAEFVSKANGLLDSRKSPMFWMKKGNGQLIKGFLVWW